MELTVKHNGDMRFSGLGPSGHEIHLDAVADVGGSESAPRPVELILAALGGCSGMDVVSILRKMRVAVDGFEMRLRGERAEEHPRVFTDIEVEYIFRGSNLEQHRSQIEKAVNLSQEKYCAVAGTLRPGVNLTYRVTLDEGSAG